jgi:hypothetical protein
VNLAKDEYPHDFRELSASGAYVVTGSELIHWRTLYSSRPINGWLLLMGSDGLSLFQCFLTETVGFFKNQCDFHPRKTPDFPWISVSQVTGSPSINTALYGPLSLCLVFSIDIPFFFRIYLRIGLAKTRETTTEELRLRVVGVRRLLSERATPTARRHFSDTAVFCIRDRFRTTTARVGMNRSTSASFHMAPTSGS